MELCTSRALSTPSLQPHRVLVNSSRFHNLRRPTHFSGLSYRKLKSLGATFDEKSNETNSFGGERSDSIATLEDVPSSVDNDVKLDNVPPVSQSLYDENRQPEPPKDEPSSDDSMQPLNELLAKFNIKLDSDDSYTIFLYGGGALVALWLLSAIVGAIDSIPVFPKLMEVVGLGYTLWFTTRYLLFKKNREELVAKIEELKREILGSDN